MSPNQKERVYIDGRIVAQAEARLPSNDGAVLYGFGFFETFRTSGGVPHHWRYNCRRLEHACDTAALVVPATALIRDEAKLRRIAQSMLNDRGLSDGVFRYTLTAGVDAEPSEILSLRPLPTPAPSHGIALRVLNLTRDSGEWLPRPKSLNYLNALMGARELQRRQASVSDEGLFLSRDGEYVVETVRQNLAWVSGGRLYYADPLLGGIAGTCLSWVLEQKDACTPVRASLEELLKAEAVFVMNSVRGITPVREIHGRDDQMLRSGIDSVMHPLVRSLQQLWADALDRTAQVSSTT